MRTFEWAVVRMPAVSIRSFRPIGMPCIGPAVPVRGNFYLGCLGLAQRLFAE